jgi:hypothetical protein
MVEENKGTSTLGLQNISEENHVEIYVGGTKKVAIGAIAAAALIIGGGTLLRKELPKLSHVYWNEPSKLAEQRALNDQSANPVQAVEEWRRLAYVAQVDGKPNDARIKANEFALETVNNLLRQADKSLDDADKKTSIDGYRTAEQKYNVVATLAEKWGLNKKEAEAAEKASDVDKLFLQVEASTNPQPQPVADTTKPIPSKASPAKVKNKK